MNIVPKFKEINKNKANFDEIYIQGDPREYFRVLYGLDYVIPDLAKIVFRQIVQALSSAKKRPIKVLDVGCSYGINAAFLKFPLDIDRLGSRYRDLECAALSSDALINLDRAYFRSWPKEDVCVVGLDASRAAVEYGVEVGLLDYGIVADLERGTLEAADVEMLRDVDLVISTGCVGYVGEKTFAQLIRAFGEEQPWIASFVLRMFDYGRLEALFSSRGLVTEKMRGVTFVQRRFHSEDECADVLGELQRRNVDVRFKESEGLLHAEFYLSRPEDACDDLALEALASVTSGANRSFGRRFSALAADRLRFGR